MEPISKSRIKQLRGLKSKKGRAEQGLYVAEGPLLLEEGFKEQAIPRYVVVSAGALEVYSAKTEAVLDTCKQQQVEVLSATDEEFSEAADTINSQGVLGVYSTPHYELASLIDKPSLTLIVLDNLRDPGNLGTIIRQAAAFDCTGILLLKGCVDPFNHKAVRSTMGGIFHVPVIPDLQAKELMETLVDAGVWPYVTATRGTNAFTLSYPPKTAFIIGGESEGVQPFWQENDVIPLTIPQTSKVESLNAAVAASIILAFRYQASVG